MFQKYKSFGAYSILLTDKIPCWHEN